MFRSGYKYRHISTLDVDILVMRVRYAGPKYYKLRVQYINRHNERLIYGTENVIIKKEDALKWEHVK